ncbi:MAG: hypothetical protein ACKVOE_04610 [Rickettsiales bacterium]
MKPNPTSFKPAPARSIAPLRICSWNFEDFTSENPAKVQRMADAITGPLGSPHILAVQEMFGPAAEREGESLENPHAAALIAAIEERSGKHYQYCEITPKRGLSGGVPGGNIRNGFFYRTDRIALSAPVIDDTPRTRGGYVATPEGLRLHQQNPQAPVMHSWAFENSRKPLLGQFTDLASDEQYFIVNVHLKSNPALYTHPDRVVPLKDERHARARRRAQALAISDYTRELWGAHSPTATNSHVIVCGDFNATVQPTAPAHSYLHTRGRRPARSTLERLEHPGFIRVTDDLPEGSSHRIGEFSSNIDHAFISWPLAERSRADRFILNQGDELERLSDHNPTLLRIAPKLQQRDATLGQAFGYLG